MIAEGLNGRTTALTTIWPMRPQRRAPAADAPRHAHAARPGHHHARRQRHEAVHLAATRFGAKQGMERLVEHRARPRLSAFDAEPPQVLIVSPPPLSETDDADFAAMFAGGIAESRKLARALSPSSRTSYGCGFFDAGTVAADHAARRRPSRRGKHPRHRRGARRRWCADDARSCDLKEEYRHGRILRRHHHRLRARAAMSPRSAPRSSASRRRSSSASIWPASAPTGAASRPRRCCARPRSSTTPSMPRTTA